RGINTQHDDIVLEPEVLKPRLVPLLQMSNKEFKNTYGHLAGAWRGKKPIQRNAILALAHFKEETAIPELQEVALNDPRPMIRGTAYWAIGQIQGEVARPFIDAHYDNELEEVKHEILKRLDMRRKKKNDEPHRIISTTNPWQYRKYCQNMRWHIYTFTSNKTIRI